MNKTRLFKKALIVVTIYVAASAVIIAVLAVFTDSSWD